MCAERSWYWGGVATGDAGQAAPYGAPYTDTQWSDNWSKIFQYDRTLEGIIPTYRSTYSSGLAVSNPAANTIRVAPGYAIVDGRFYENSADIDTAAADGSYSVVLRRVLASQTVRMVIRSTGVTQTDATWEIKLADVTVAGGAVTSIIDRRQVCNVAGGMVLLNKTRIAADGDTVLWSLIPGCFTSLKIIYSASCPAAPAAVPLIYMNFNGDGGANYGYIKGFQDTASITVATSTPVTAGVAGYVPNLIGGTIASGTGECIIGRYSNTTVYKVSTANCGVYNTSFLSSAAVTSVWRSAAAITGIALTEETGAGFTAGSIFELYGIP